jgi:hypothetical protein
MRISCASCIHVNRFEGLLIVPIQGLDSLELKISDIPGDAQRAADALETGLQKHVFPIDPSLPEVDRHGFALRTEEDRRKALRWMLIALVGGALGLGIFIHPAAGVVVLFLGLMCTGIILGTQEKEMWQ